VVVFVNSKQQDIEPGATVAALIETLGLGRQRVAVEVNAKLVTRNDWALVQLQAGDRIEIVSFVGGG
jgi:thiamine biosynthesis protein ThiS